MASDIESTRSTLPPCFHKAKLRIITSRGAEKKAVDVILFIYHRIYWKVAKHDKDGDHISLVDFKAQSSLEQWEEVEETIKPHDEHTPSLIAPGKIRGRARWSTVYGDVTLILVPDEATKCDEWVRELRTRITPATLLQSRAEALYASSSNSTSVAEVTIRTDALLTGDVSSGNKNNSTTAQSPSGEVCDPSDSSRHPRLSEADKRIQRFEWVDKFNTQISSLIGTIATVVNKPASNTKGTTGNTGGAASNMEGAASIAKEVADFAKIIPGGSAVFQLIALSVLLAGMYAEANRGYKGLPELLSTAVNRLAFVTESASIILQVSDEGENSEGFLESNVFEVVVVTLELMRKIEAQMMRNGWERFCMRTTSSRQNRRWLY